MKSLIKIFLLLAPSLSLADGPSDWKVWNYRLLEPRNEEHDLFDHCNEYQLEVQGDAFRWAMIKRYIPCDSTQVGLYHDPDTGRVVPSSLSPEGSRSLGAGRAVAEEGLRTSWPHEEPSPVVRYLQQDPLRFAYNDKGECEISGLKFYLDLYHGTDSDQEILNPRINIVANDPVFPTGGNSVSIRFRAENSIVAWVRMGYYPKEFCEETPKVVFVDVCAPEHCGDNDVWKFFEIARQLGSDFAVAQMKYENAVRTAAEIKQAEDRLLGPEKDFVFRRDPRRSSVGDKAVSQAEYELLEVRKVFTKPEFLK